VRSYLENGTFCEMRLKIAGGENGYKNQALNRAHGSGMMIGRERRQKQ